jgi:hypothetical protein
VEPAGPDALEWGFGRAPCAARIDGPAVQEVDGMGIDAQRIRAARERTS